jgi:hypothetical protein
VEEDPVTHTGEEFFTIGWPEYGLLVICVVCFTVLALRRALPSMAAFKDFADVINSAGGNILLLSLFTGWSVKIAMQFFYHLLALPDDRLSKADAIVTAGIAFVTGTMFGTFAGALIKTLSGGKANGNPPAAAPDTLTVGFVPPDGAKK